MSIPILSRHGEVEVSEPDRPARTYKSFVCPHCNRIIIVKPGSGRQRGFCFRCMKPTCGVKPCDRCIPWEAKLEAMEGRRRFWKEMELNSQGKMR